MDKPKRKNEQPTFLDGLFDLLLLAKHFEYEVEWTPAQCAQRLEKLEGFERGFLKAASQNVAITPVDEQTYDFAIDTQRIGRNMSYYTARAQGVVAIDKGIESTIVRGRIRLGRAIVFGFVALLLEMVVLFALLPEVIGAFEFLIVLIGAHLIFLLLQLTDYGKLIKRIDDTFSPDSESKKKKNDG